MAQPDVGTSADRLTNLLDALLEGHRSQLAQFLALRSANGKLLLFEGDEAKGDKLGEAIEREKLAIENLEGSLSLLAEHLGTPKLGAVEEYRIRSACSDENLPEYIKDELVKSRGQEIAVSLNGRNYMIGYNGTSVYKVIID